MNSKMRIVLLKYYYKSVIRMFNKPFDCRESRQALKIMRPHDSALNF